MKTRSEKILSKDFDFLVPRLTKEGLEENRILEMITEYKRYLLLRLNHPEELPMYSVPVDKVWHAHILFTQEYRTFCDEVFGHYLDHRPFTKSEFKERLHEYESVTLLLYRETFGEKEPSLWHVTQ